MYTPPAPSGTIARTAPIAVGMFGRGAELCACAVGGSISNTVSKIMTASVVKGVRWFMGSPPGDNEFGNKKTFVQRAKARSGECPERNLVMT
jgi:hypothetical protein